MNARTNAVSADAESSVQLFRPEALAERHSQWLGTVLLTPRPSHYFVTLAAALALTATLSLLFFGDFTRKARIGGWLMPEEGMVRVFAPRTGVVTSLRVSEGASVRRGEPLLTLSGELQSASLGATQAGIARQLAERRRILLDERRR